MTVELENGRVLVIPGVLWNMDGTTRDANVNFGIFWGTHSEGVTCSVADKATRRNRAMFTISQDDAVELAKRILALAPEK